MVDVSQYASFTFADISPFEMFLYSATRDMVTTIFDHLPIYQVFRLYRLNVRIAVIVHHYARTTWSINDFLDKWFGLNSSDEVVDKLEECGAIISGSTVLQFLSRSPPDPNSDLDIYVPLTGLLEFGRWLQHMGYAYRPRGTSPFTFFDVAALTVPARWSSGKNSSSTCDPLSFLDPFEIFDFIDESDRRLSTSRSDRLQLVVVLGDPRKHVLTFHSSAHISQSMTPCEPRLICICPTAVVMNYISHSKAVCLFPVSTLEAKMTWVWRGSSATGAPAYGVAPAWDAKYRSRGFSVIDGYTRETFLEPDELRPQRVIGDEHTWTLDFDKRRKLRACLPRSVLTLPASNLCAAQCPGSKARQSRC